MEFSANDRFLPHRLDAAAVEQLQKQLNAVHGLREAYLVRKVVSDDEATVFVLAASANVTWQNGQSGKHINSLFEQLVNLPRLPEPLVFVSLDGPNGFLDVRLAEIEGSRLFSRT